MSMRSENLQKLMDIQLRIQRKHFDKILELSSEEQLLINTRAMMHEVLEVERELNWKHWKKAKEVNWEDVKSEIIDEFIFLLNQWNIVSADADELVEMTITKMSVNEDRQKSGY